MNQPHYTSSNIAFSALTRLVLLLLAAGPATAMSPLPIYSGSSTNWPVPPLLTDNLQGTIQALAQAIVALQGVGCGLCSGCGYTAGAPNAPAPSWPGVSPAPPEYRSADTAANPDESSSGSRHKRSVPGYPSSGYSFLPSLPAGLDINPYYVYSKLSYKNELDNLSGYRLPDRRFSYNVPHYHNYNYNWGDYY